MLSDQAWDAAGLCRSTRVDSHPGYRQRRTDPNSSDPCPRPDILLYPGAQATSDGCPLQCMCMRRWDSIRICRYTCRGRQNPVPLFPQCRLGLRGAGAPGREKGMFPVTCLRLSMFDFSRKAWDVKQKAERKDMAFSSSQIYLRPRCSIAYAQPQRSTRRMLTRIHVLMGRSRKSKTQERRTNDGYARRPGCCWDGHGTLPAWAPSSWVTAILYIFLGFCWRAVKAHSDAQLLRVASWVEKG